MACSLGHVQGCKKFATSTLFSFPLQKAYQNASYWNHNFETTLIYKNNIYFANFSTPPPLLVVNHMQDTKELILWLFKSKWSRHGRYMGRHISEGTVLHFPLFPPFFFWGSLLCFFPSIELTRVIQTEPLRAISVPPSHFTVSLTPVAFLHP